MIRKRGTPRQRQAGAVRKFRHVLRERLLLALFWLGTYPTLELWGFFFDLDKIVAVSESVPGVARHDLTLLRHSKFLDA